ncbi:hypothetical protein GCM10011387_21410 [Pedobacter quisquiliarum]|jgi:hypothetical protein|uniref:Uncharacterized protein n=1 Tax=Pedobacter quisquiliarum TaxID=1834438 RepID=A0A916UCX4_9SPHI|nr:hypothetical protein GCM10011387_21410 [Pedobacter quisquiliarum]
MKKFALISYHDQAADLQLCASIHEVNNAITSLREAGFLPVCVIDTIDLIHMWLITDQSYYATSVVKLIEEQIFNEEIR